MEHLIWLRKTYGYTNDPEVLWETQPRGLPWVLRARMLRGPNDHFEAALVDTRPNPLGRPVVMRQSVGGLNVCLSLVEQWSDAFLAMWVQTQAGTCLGDMHRNAKDYFGIEDSILLTEIYDQVFDARLLPGDFHLTIRD